MSYSPCDLQLERCGIWDKQEMDSYVDFVNQLDFFEDDFALSSNVTNPNHKRIDFTMEGAQHDLINQYSNSLINEAKHEQQTKMLMATKQSALLNPDSRSGSSAQNIEKDEKVALRNNKPACAVTSRANWSHREEVFLVGAVLERFFRKGSLASKCKGKGNNDENECWNEIKETYDCTWRMTEIPQPQERTSKALARHYKLMKAKVNNLGGKLIRNFRDYYNEYEHTLQMLAEQKSSVSNKRRKVSI